MWYQQWHDILLQYWSGPQKFVSYFSKKSKKNQVNPGKVNGQTRSKSTVNAGQSQRSTRVTSQRWSTDDVEMMLVRANVALTRQQW